MNTDLKQKLENLPDKPGIYQFKDANGKVLYVGKAKNLKNRVRSYFHNSVTAPKTLAMVGKAEDLELIVTENEVEALVLENNLIKEFKPRYNINLRDDKTYPYIRVTNEPFPQIFPTRNVIRDGSTYFGPYTDVKNMKNSLRMMNQIFKIRSCKYMIDDEAIEKKKFKICLDYHINKCGGPCEGLVSQAEYREMVDEVKKLLRGKTDVLISDLKEKMDKAAAGFNFEKAAELRDKIRQLEQYSEKQRIVSAELIDRDIISVSAEYRDVACVILNIRAGKLIGKKQFRLSANEGEDQDKVYEAVIRFYYNEYVDVPREIILETEPADMETLAEWLAGKAGHKVKFIIPKRKSEPQALLDMSKKNSVLLLKEIQIQRMQREGNIPHVLAALKRDLRLKNIPRKIECFDISNLQGTDTVASMVVFVDGKPKKRLYRKFIIKSVDGPNDFASMQEVISRRYGRLVEENEPFPDLIMVDGGKGQLSSAVEILDNLNAPKYEIIGLAKRLEEVFLPGNPEAQTIPKTSSSLKLLQHARDEAHRFAITFHRSRRSKRTFTTELTEIEGIGPKLAEKLLKKFRSLAEIKNATIGELALVVGEAKAKVIHGRYHKDNGSENKTE